MRSLRPSEASLFCGEKVRSLFFTGVRSLIFTQKVRSPLYLRECVGVARRRHRIKDVGRAIVLGKSGNLVRGIC
ncbi:hypothetical protein [Limnofasciculus baicalensis]|uniref:Uncharacterized protein n=1 Tax=Limnofasciculus baicalensis BBK-W-15 TaxID=2699891 RepID=A0AAE3GU22_9CYAN|nr:hypothetical protein [Limnofasciculus baicalensis]MCP2730676.1 hypothetical protein [Limnofasciculus baicalensis BBK-W-15]